MRIASVGLDAAESEVGHAVAATFPQGLFMVYVLAGDCGRTELLHHRPAGFVPSGSLCDLFRLALVFGVMLRVVSFCCPGHYLQFHRFKLAFARSAGPFDFFTTPFIRAQKEARRPASFSVFG